MDENKITEIEEIDEQDEFDEMIEEVIEDVYEDVYEDMENVEEALDELQDPVKELLERKQYDTIYLMLGINELGYRFERVEAQYNEILEQIKGAQGEAKIYLCANLHVTKEQSEKDCIFNNKNINRVNQMIEASADNERTYYLDVNVLFDDEEGNLSTDYSSDSFHVLGRYYTNWVDWIRQQD